MKLKTLFSTLLILFLIFSCKKEKVGGPCTYAEIEQEMVVTFIDGSIDGDFMVSFQLKGIDTDDVYRITKEQFAKINRNFDLKALENKSNSYTVSIEEITKGSCTPFVIRNIKLQ